MNTKPSTDDDEAPDLYTDRNIHVDWQRLPDRQTPDGQTLITEVAEIDGETWYVGNIPDDEPQEKGEQ